ncbi:MAG: N-formylglutamate amidohydrolase [Pseudomonadota bacterium]
MTEPAFYTFGETRDGPWVVTCDHASNRVPEEIGGGDLGLASEDMNRHIAFDIGAAGVAEALADHLGAVALLSNFSRLVIDPNRGEDDPTLVMKLYDGTIIPANRDVDAAETARRLEAYYRPYGNAVAGALAARPNPILVSVHSFTPQFKGRPPRPWHVSVLHTEDMRLADPLLTALREDGDWVVGVNEPYTGKLEGDAVDRYATSQGRPNALIEIRNDLISDGAGQQDWAQRLARCLTQAREAAGL